ncbi:Serine/threonine-protein phosphatase 2A 55 kDa regulatory subunit B delta isoform [Varanus komodoensis]|nr:Serine/threonine-protein phosphatase 2A 55 kDa regulatory subunit B delta isoform [Varanus komodoensis]
MDAKCKMGAKRNSYSVKYKKGIVEDSQGKNRMAFQPPATLCPACFRLQYTTLPNHWPCCLRFMEAEIQTDIISTVEFNYSGDLLATGDKGGRVVIFQREAENKSRPHSRGEYNVYSTFQSHEPEFDYLKSLEIEEKINKIRWLPQQNAAHFLLSTNGKDLFIYKV